MLKKMMTFPVPCFCLLEGNGAADCGKSAGVGAVARMQTTRSSALGTIAWRTRIEDASDLIPPHGHDKAEGDCIPQLIAHYIRHYTRQRQRHTSDTSGSSTTASTGAPTRTPQNTASDLLRWGLCRE